jgi:hypothetical protein
MVTENVEELYSVDCGGPGVLAETMTDSEVAILVWQFR